MKSRLLILFLSISIYSFGQKRDLKSFTFQDQTIEYSRIDYSNYGIAQFFITMYSDDTKFNLVEQSAYNCLRRKDRIYHTLYFFIKVPSSIGDSEVKNKLFSEFVKHLKEEEKKTKIDLYLNFDEDYSAVYQTKQKSEKKNDVKRVNINISVKTICQSLTIR
ncbi:hypothetical protein A9Q87_12600 [Flavobacteriales bacterium 34_180_T64]|nr:hypothetical protein A9Q87_12600 [Flavobacteriales bacterium 34_180_T64]